MLISHSISFADIMTKFKIDSLEEFATLCGSQRLSLNLYNGKKTINTV